MEKAGNQWIAAMAAAALFVWVGSALGEEKSAAITVEQQAAAPKPGQVMVLSLQESVLLGLKNNLDIAIEGFNPKVREADITAAKAVFDPAAFAEVSFANTRTPGRSALTQTRVNVNQDLDFNVGLRQELPTGGRYELRFDNNRNFNNAAFFTAARNGIAYTSDLTLTLTQPFLKNFGVDINRVRIKIAKNEWEISLDRLRQRTMDVITQVQAAYWDLVFALENLKVQERSLRLARELAELNRARARAGVAAPVEITQAEAEIAARDGDAITAEKGVRDAEDRLKVVLNIPREGEWGGAILPADPARFSPVTLDLPQAVAAALRKRPEYQTAKVELANRELNLRFARNQLLPDLSFQGSVGLNGLDAGGPVTDPSYGDNLSVLGSGDFFNYSAGLVLTIPLGNRAARAEFIKTRLARDQAEVSLRNLELQITAEVREAVRRVRADTKRVEATKAARVLAEEQLRIEQKRLEAGVSTTFEVLRLQRDLAAAQANEVKALTDYNKSLATMDRVRGVVLGKHHVEL
ncbi:MAG: TolC family protein [Candidatus Methylomirabilales bacterium]